ncbi:PAS domain S-box protein [Longimicrobium sp.]|uniref:hybrid sensor histidine kinase/response regulator n=1 Tax=Longimicrobium sp. TaxID=2029185 RepID=UPI002BDBA394|nr:PAS domain S-box protein [Longimicrobium sp.]HSU17385.1 PAS domain S-box protein [Longimicrobium sp.]
MRRVDWAATPVGPAAGWPAGLRAAVDMVMGSRFPMVVMWGPELILLYNDAYIPILGMRHPAAMGRPARECWPEIWHVTGPMLQRVMETGEATWSEDARFLLDRRGTPEEAFFTFSYSPVRGDGGEVAGIFVSIIETTEHVLARRRSQAVARTLAAASAADDAEVALQLAAAAAVGEDLPWAAVFRPDGPDRLPLRASAGLPDGVLDADAWLDPRDPAVARALATDRAMELDPSHVHGLHDGGEAGRIVAVRVPGLGGGILLAGVNPHLPLETESAAFLGRVARAIGAAIDRVGRLARAEGERIAVLERMTDGFFALDGEWRFAYLNPVAQRLARRPSQELIGRTLWEAMPELRGTDFEAAFRHAMRRQVPRRVTGRAPRGGEWLEVHAYPSREGLSVFFRDASERVRMEAQRAELLERERRARADAEAAERRVRELVEGLDAIIWEATGDPIRFTFVSEHARALLGYPVERWLDEPGFWEALIHPEDRGWVVDLCARATREERDHAFEYRVRAADGRTLWLRDVVRVARGADGRVHLRGVMVDATARRRREDEVLRLAAVVGTMDDAVVCKAFDGTILSWNAAAVRLFGWSEAETVGRPVFEFLSPETHAEEREILARVAAGERVAGREMERTRSDGRRVLVCITVSPVRDAAGRVQCAAVVARDLTDERRLQAQLRQAQKMEAVGRLAGGIAHDFNNLLTAIKGNAGLLLGDLPAASPWREEVEEIDRASQRASDLTRQLLAFSRRQVLQPRVVDLNAVIADTRRMLRRLIEEDVEIDVALDPGAGRVEADPGQVEQVVLNLAVNARDAMPGGGRLAISTSAASVPQEPRTGWPYYVAPGDYVRLDVRDSGMGMEPDILAHLFEPFFTTKPAGKGTGLGLSTVYGIVKQSGGYVWAESQVGAGSRFVVLLPRVPDAGAAPAPAPEAAPGRGCGATVLLVEDEDSVRSLARRVLARAGYQVLEAPDGERALEVAGAHAGAIDLLLTDVVMPGGGGRKLADAMGRVRPATRVLYMSGYPGDAIAEHGLAPEVDLLPKPFSPDTLLRRVASALGGP